MVYRKLGLGRSEHFFPSLKIENKCLDLPRPNTYRYSDIMRGRETMIDSGFNLEILLLKMF